MKRSLSLDLSIDVGDYEPINCTKVQKCNEEMSSPKSTTPKTPNSKQLYESLRAKAEQILMSNDKLPRIISIDLDYTLWPCFCYEHLQGPFDNVFEQNGYISPNKISCISKQTKNFRTVSLYKEALDVLNLCKKYNITLTICSRSPDKTAKEILETLNIYDWFLHPQIFRARKTYHFRNLVELTKLKYEDFLFFDDDKNNIKACSNLNITSYLIDRQNGLDLNSFINGLMLYKNKSITKILRIDQIFQRIKKIPDNLIEIEDNTSRSDSDSVSDSY